MSRDARERLAAAIRTLISHAVETDIDPADAQATAERIEQIAGELDRHPRREPKMPKYPHFEDLQINFGDDPVIGKSNPIAPPVEVSIDGKIVRAHANVGRQYEGPPGFVHGAVIASIFDMVLGLVNVVSGNAGMTGTLTVRYRRPTPLNTDLDVEAHVERVDGRKVFTKGTISATGTLTAECEGIFVALTEEMGADLFPTLDRNALRERLEARERFGGLSDEVGHND